LPSSTSSSSDRLDSVGGPDDRQVVGLPGDLAARPLDEVLELSDRIGVIFRGRLVTTVAGETARKEEIGLIMATGEVGERAEGAA